MCADELNCWTLSAQAPLGSLDSRQLVEHDARLDASLEAALFKPTQCTDAPHDTVRDERLPVASTVIQERLPVASTVMQERNQSRQGVCCPSGYITSPDTHMRHICLLKILACFFFALRMRCWLESGDRTGIDY